MASLSNPRHIVVPTNLHSAGQKQPKAFRGLIERGLTNEQKVAIMDLFETNTVAADMFLAVDEDEYGLRWAWLSNKLVQMGHLALPAHAEMSSVQQ